MKRSRNYTRKMKAGGHNRHFDFVEACYGPDAKAEAQRIAQAIRTGKREGLWGHRGPHWVRVVSMNWHRVYDHDYGGLFRVYAVYCFPVDEEV